MSVCYVCKNKDVKLYEIKSLTKPTQKELFCSNCCDTDLEKCKCCEKENYACYMFKIDEDDDSYYDYGSSYFCSLDCLFIENGNGYFSCVNCNLLKELPSIYIDKKDNNYCSSYCASINNLELCAVCNKYNNKSELYLYDKINNSIYKKCFSHGKCKNCKQNNFIRTTDKELLNLYYKGFCSLKCESTFGKEESITKDNMVDVFSNNDKKFLKMIIQNNNKRKQEINQYKNLFKVYNFFEKELGWRHIHTESEFLYKEINGVIFIIGRGFVFSFSDKSVFGRTGWLYNYVNNIDLSVIKELSKTIKDFEYALYFYEGRINKFNYNLYKLYE